MSKEAEAEILAIFQPLGVDLARDIIAHRKGKKCPLTPRGAKALMKEYLLTGNAIAAAEEHLNRGWQGFKAEWIKRPGNYRDPHNPMPRQTGNMADFTREVMDRYHERERIQTTGHRSFEHALEDTAPPRGVGRTWDA